MRSVVLSEQPPTHINTDCYLVVEVRLDIEEFRGGGDQQY